MELFGEYLKLLWEILKGHPGVMWGGLIILSLVIAVILIRLVNGKKKSKEKPPQVIQSIPREHFIPEGYYWCNECKKAHSPNSKIGKKHLQYEPKIKKEGLSAGSFKCLCFRKINGTLIADFRDGEYGLPEPIGEQYQFDPSCPISGLGSIIIEEDGVIKDYDPRQVEYKTEESPEFAYLATNWRGVVNSFWKVPEKWWKNVSTWFAGAMIILVFFTSLMFFD